MSTTTEDPPTRVVGPADNPVAVALVVVNESLDSVAQVPVWSLTEAQLQAGLSEALAVRARVEQLTSRLLGSVQARDTPGRGVFVNAGVVGVEGAGLGW